MGNHRATIKMEMTFHGKTEKADWWINWSPHGSECEGVDDRVIEWFRRVSEAGFYRYQKDVYELQREDRERKEREHELQELTRLKAKYEPAKPSGHE